MKIEEAKKKSNMIRIVSAIILVLLIALTTSGCMGQKDYPNQENSVLNLKMGEQYKVLDVRESFAMHSYYNHKISLVLEDSFGRREYISNIYVGDTISSEYTDVYLSLAKIVPGDIVERNEYNSDMLTIVKTN